MLAWAPNSEADLAGYKIHYGTDSLNYTSFVDVANPVPENGLVTVSMDYFSPGVTYYISATAYNDSGLESDYCPEVVWDSPVVVPENNAPQASNRILNTFEDEVSRGNLLASDIDSGSLSYTLIADAFLGMVAIGADSGSYTCTQLMTGPK